MKNWLMLTIVGQDKPGIAAAVTDVLSGLGCMLGEASMMRLGNTFSIMMMVCCDGRDPDSLSQELAGVVESFDLALHIDAVNSQLHSHIQPNVEIRVKGADRAGIVSSVTGLLAEAGVNIIDLESDVIGTEDEPVYFMNITGVSTVPLEELQRKLDASDIPQLDVNVSGIETMIG